LVLMYLLFNLMYYKGLVKKLAVFNFA